MPRNALPDLAGKTICDGQITLHETLGNGSFGRVFMGKSTNGTPLAVKVMAQGASKTRLGVAQARELAIHHPMGKHPNIITLHAAVSDEDFIYMVMEYCPGGDLYNHLKNRSFIGDTDGVKRIFGQVVDAVHTCHAHGVFHRDLKLDNILMSKDGMNAYLSDFGLSTTSKSGKHTVGTKTYESPECLQASSLQQEFEHAPNDVWALGVILCCMISRCRPWNLADDTDPYFTTFCQDPRWLYDTLPISEEAFQLLNDIFTIDPRFRVTLPELKKRVAEMKTFFRDLEMDSSVHAGEVEVVDGHIMDELEEVAIPLSKWKDRVQETINHVFAGLSLFFPFFFFFPGLETMDS